jgi:hypothetical protein
MKKQRRMTLYSILATLIISLIVVFFTARISRRPFWSLWMVLLIVFLATWNGQIWLTSYGPFTAGISWYALIFVSIFVAILTMVFIPHTSKARSKDPDDKITMTVGLFFWITMVLLIVFVGLGFYLVR